jgi:uncharacterized protein (TIGR02145 family)
LKTTSGWNNSGNGSDEFGLSFLPGGYFYWYNRFDILSYYFFGIGEYGVWWVDLSYLDVRAYSIRLNNQNGSFEILNTFDKVSGISVRCVRD